MKRYFNLFNPMQEPSVYTDGSGEDFDPRTWNHVFYDDPTYLQIVNGMPLPCTDIIWINPEKRCMYLAWRNVHSTQGPWMFGGRQRRGETPREAALRLLSNEVGTSIDEADLHFVQTAIAFSKYRAQAPQDNGAHYVLFHYCYTATDDIVRAAEAKLVTPEYNLKHGIQEYDRARIEAFDPKGPFGFNRAILLEEFTRIFGLN